MRECYLDCTSTEIGVKPKKKKKKFGSKYRGLTCAIAILFRTPCLYPEVRSRMENSKLMKHEKRALKSRYRENFMTEISL